jgi:membrane-bound lytic murein transglycosylase D
MSAVRKTEQRFAARAVGGPSAKLARRHGTGHAPEVRRGYLLFWLAGGTAVFAAEAPAPVPAPPASDQLYQLGQQLFDQYAPPEVKAQYDFPTKEQWDGFAARLQAALDHGSLGDLAALEPEARAALVSARAIPEAREYADWLELRLDEMEAARQALAPLPPTAGAARRPLPAIPLFDLWQARLRGRPLPAGASLMPRLQPAFSAAGVPPELAWLAEAESDLNPGARSPAGARGLFQLMPETAHHLGLGTFLPDDRSDPEKSAAATARYLRGLYARFGSWPLALAAYNAGEGRVARLLAARGASDFAGIAPALPVETRMYVPKVLALVDLRTGVAPARLAAPGGEKGR